MRMHTPARRRDTALRVEPELTVMLANPVLPKRVRLIGGTVVDVLMASDVRAWLGPPTPVPVVIDGDARRLVLGAVDGDASIPTIEAEARCDLLAGLP